jgi:acyl-coenzyme A thioesterase PaaI-like protein
MGDHLLDEANELWAATLLGRLGAKITYLDGHSVVLVQPRVSDAEEVHSVAAVLVATAGCLLAADAAGTRSAVPAEVSITHCAEWASGVINARGTLLSMQGRLFTAGVEISDARERQLPTALVTCRVERPLRPVR